MEELSTAEKQTINKITSTESLRNKRAAHQCQIDKLQKKFATFNGLPLNKLNKSEIESALHDLKKQVAMAAALQQRLELIVTPEEQEAEVSEGEKLDEASTKVLRLAQETAKLKSAHEQYQALCDDLEELKEHEGRTSAYFGNLFSEFRAQVKEFSISVSDVREDNRVRRLIKHLRDELTKISVLVAKEIELKEKEVDKSKVVKGPVKKASKGAQLNIDPPKFNGQPLAWKAFQEMFEAVLSSRGSSLSDVEKVSLLLAAMSTEESQEVVNRNSEGGKNYNKAMEALAEQYESVHVIYPILVKTINQPEKFEYSLQGLNKFYDRIILPYQHLHSIAGDSLSTYLVQFAKQSFSPKLREEWNRHMVGKEELPTLDDVKEYFSGLRKQMEPGDTAATASTSVTPTVKGKPVRTPIKCPLCGDKHNLVRCSSFADYDVEKRNKVVRDKRLCTNCLGEGHGHKNCPSKYTCRTCYYRHHTMLHREKSSSETSVPALSIRVVESEPQASSRDSTGPPPVFGFSYTVMTTAINGGRHAKARAVIDPGSGISLISEKLASHLLAKRHPQSVRYDGVHGQGYSKSYVHVDLMPLDKTEESINITFSVIPHIKSVRPPSYRSTILSDPVVQDLTLADTEMGGEVDLILGNMDKRKFSKVGEVEHPGLHLLMLKTLFGWSISGPLVEGENPPMLHIQPTVDPLQQSIDRLLEMDRVPEAKSYSKEDEQILEEFLKSHSIANDGRYKVSLPRLTDPPTLGESKAQAVKRYVSNEKSLKSKGKLEQFVQVLKEYVAMGHAEKVPFKELLASPSYYLPVHGVFKESSSTTKLRAVFDASAKSSNGVSLNDTLLAGPNLYPLLTDVLIRFRCHRIGLSADISKMFREILLNSEEKDFHRFVMREDNGRIQDYRMRRLTFGVKSSPYLATQVLCHLASQHSDSHPQASQAILNHFYVDDYLSGADTVEEVDALRKQLCDLLLRAGMTLRKWKTNSMELRQLIPDELSESQDLHLSAPESMPKALGVHWNVSKDTLHISTPDTVNTEKVTKRSMASDTARVFDILGLFAPALMPARILLQSLWKKSLSWDKPVPGDVLDKWKVWASHLHVITEYSIDRRMTPYNSPVLFKSLHRLSDASSVAYGAAIYLRQIHEGGQVSITLVTAKARVLPLKPMTIPRAELVAARLLMRLITHVADLIGIPLRDVFTWTDSAIVIHWLRKDASQLTTFVCNRVSDIQNHLPASHWRHVRSKENPADLLSRGIYAIELVKSKLWWKGPPWLEKSPIEWPVGPPALAENLPEIRTHCHAIKITPPQAKLWSRYSSFHTLIRVIAWIFRFCRNAKKPAGSRVDTDILSTQEISQARGRLLLLSQQYVAEDAISLVSANKVLPRTHPLSKLLLTMGKDGLLHVRCRVRDLQTPTKAKELIFLSLKSDITRLMLSTLHKTYGHPGTATFVSIISDIYYISSLHNFAKKLSRECAICQRAYARPLSYQMGMLPASRTKPAPVFSTVGIDFAGPFTIKLGATRKPVLRKVYACVIVCMTTRAVHLDLCKDLSTEEFLMIFKRFMNRRGVPSHIYSDNGTNFSGAKSEIKALQSLMESRQTRSSISQLATSMDLQWHHIPPRAPHFGGLWEASVKAMKTLLRKLVTPHPLTFDELYTLLTEVEAVLNSRPLAPLNSDVVKEDLCLTPGHFIIGRPIRAPPVKDASGAKISSLRRWRLLERLTQDLWNAWLSRYLQSVYHRSKWQHQSRALQQGDIVYAKDETLKYRQWPLALVTRTYPGDDGIVRIADIRCHGKTYTRAANRLVPFMTAEDYNSSLPSSAPKNGQASPSMSTSSSLPDRQSSSPEDVQDSA